MKNLIQSILRKTTRRDSSEESYDAGSKFLFVYGTLMRDFENYSFLNTPCKAAYFSKGTIPGALYDIGAFPGFAPDDREGVVIGEVFQIKIAASLFEALDIVEGCNDIYPERSLFVRTTAKARLESGEEMQVWVYRYNLSVSGLTRIPNGDYREYVNA